MDSRISIYGWSRPGFLDEPVTHADDGLDLPAGGAQFAAKAADMDVHRSGFHLPIEAPHAFEQPIPRQYPVAVFDEKTQQLEFAPGQPDLSVGAGRLKL